MKKLLNTALACLLAIGLAGCGSSSTAAATEAAAASDAAGTAATTGGSLTIYSPNSDDLINAVVPAFEQKTGIKVEVISAGTGDCLTRIDSEKDNPQADVMTPFSDIKVVYEDIDLCAEKKSEWQQKWTDMFTSAN